MTTIPRPADIPEGHVHRSELLARPGWTRELADELLGGSRLRTTAENRAHVSPSWYPTEAVESAEADPGWSTRSAAAVAQAKARDVEIAEARAAEHAARAEARRAKRPPRAPNRTADQWIAIVESFVNRSGMHSIKPGDKVLDPETQQLAAVGRWYSEKAWSRGYLTAEQQARLKDLLQLQQVPRA